MRVEKEERKKSYPDSEKLIKKSNFFRRNVCPHEEVEIVTLKEPCVQAYTKYVRSRKPGCNGKFQSCAVRQPKTIYFHTYKKVNRTRRHTIAECCPGWVHRPGEAGCQREDNVPLKDVCFKYLVSILCHFIIG
ncbi:Protein CBG26259 [Caenorhabditis briggsae]|uniref:Protein CBG26259 n=1 Tax=Caenorhabditis briggsae TaxID=6238 RepID=B6IKY5_CAEBR|nr:Protein CBG26259 [Caenorhabditis briggsae]CAS00565.1 Protein CBG26259 [Caenorhabditis briggsae]